MKTVIMAGGRSTRLKGAIEKPILDVYGRTLLDRTMAAALASKAKDVVVTVTDFTPKTRELCSLRGYDCVDTPGEGYHHDVYFLLDMFGPYLSINVDIPLLRSDDIDAFLPHCGKGSMACVVPIEFIDWEMPEDGVYIDGEGRKYAWVGLNYVTPEPETETVPFNERRLAVNINSVEDIGRFEEMIRESDRNLGRSANRATEGHSY